MDPIKIQTLKKKIISEVSRITETNFFLEWIDTQSTTKIRNQIVAINNSFIFRESIKRSKSGKFIAFDISSTKEFDTNKIFIVEGISFNSTFKLITLTANQKKIKIEKAIKDELKEIGEVIYAIVGEIQDVNEISEQINNANFKKISLIPTLTTDFQVVGEEIRIKDYSDRELIWKKIDNHCKANSIAIANNFPSLIDKALESLQNNAFSTLSIPKKFNPETMYLLDKILIVIENHLESYNKNMGLIDADPKAIIEILRI